LRIYHYISDAKLDMLAGSIAEPFWKKLSASLNIELPFVKAALGNTTSDETRYSKVALVERQLHDDHEVGPILDFGKRTKFFAGTIPMQWGPYLHHEPTFTLSGEPMVWFAGESESVILGLGGSFKHVIGQTPQPVPNVTSGKPGYPVFTSRSQMFEILDRLRGSVAGAQPADDEKTRRQVATDVAMTTREALLSYHHAGVPPTDVEFLAFRLLDGRHGGKDVVLGSPVFVATP
jgi:uncharacterized protein DUF7019